MTSSTLVAQAVEQPVVPPVEEPSPRAGRRPSLPPWRRLVGASALAVLVALPAAAQVEVASARRDLEADRRQQRMASSSTRARRSLVSSTEGTLSRAEADVAAAADEVGQARVLLAASGVDEQAIVTVLEQTQLWLDTVVLRRADVNARIDQQELDLPVAKECVLDGNRALAGMHASAPPCLVTPAP